VFGAAPEKVMLLFKEIDTSGDGLVSRKEFALAMRALGLALPHRELRLLFESLDPDRSNSIDYAELREALES
jgi:Ca2+-binding EF-hand superfamily protein